MNSALLLHDLQRLPDSRIKHTLVRKTVAGAYHCPASPYPNHTLLDDLNHTATRHLQAYALQGRYDARSPHAHHQLANLAKAQAQPPPQKKTQSQQTQEMATKGKTKV